MYTFVYLRIHEIEQSVFCHDGCTNEQHTHQEDGSSNNMNTANLVSQFINEEISVKMRKGWRWKPSLINKEINIHLSCHSHLISNFNANNITCHHKKSKAVPNEIIIRETEKMHIILYL